MTGDVEYISVSGICGKRKGWTKGRIAKFLGEPDKLAPNPHYRTASPMRLYEMGRVKMVEDSAEFQNSITKAEVRKSGGVRAAEKKRQNQIDTAMLLHLDTTKLPMTSNIPQHLLEDEYCDGTNLGKIEYLCQRMLTPEMSELMKREKCLKEILVKRMLGIIQDMYPDLHKSVHYELWEMDGCPVTCKHCGDEHEFIKEYHPFCSLNCKLACEKMTKLQKYYTGKSRKRVWSATIYKPRMRPKEFNRQQFLKRQTDSSGSSRKDG